ncbi:uncharacterized protein LOC121711967 [Alosa sapidissima]|uniref:uncharacterized protein LOC121711967 n=1 Tax=Alosa sapidissima TaxID=34773 RepID=UPI001C091990|nr:uncharacterized protein LOC121711967 [Alosa sapidissima]
MLRASRKEPQSASPPQTGGTRPKNPKVSNPGTSGAVQAPGGARDQPAPGRGHRESETRQYYRCGEMGHISWQCGKPADEPMPTAESSSSPPAHIFASLVGVVTVNHHDVEALLNSGSRVTLVRKDLVDSSCLTPGKVLTVSCVHGDTRDYPTTELAMTTTRGTILTMAGVYLGSGEVRRILRIRKYNPQNHSLQPVLLEGWQVPRLIQRLVQTQGKRTWSQEVLQSPARKTSKAPKSFPLSQASMTPRTAGHRQGGLGGATVPTADPDRACRGHERENEGCLSHDA